MGRQRPHRDGAQRGQGARHGQGPGRAAQWQRQARRQDARGNALSARGQARLLLRTLDSLTVLEDGRATLHADAATPSFSAWPRAYLLAGWSTNGTVAGCGWLALHWFACTCWIVEWDAPRGSCNACILVQTKERCIAVV